MNEANIDNMPLELRPPSAEDGAAVFRLIAECAPLDPNSLYCNLLQCSHFAATSVAAVYGDKLAGFISGYLLPEHQDTLFVWQVAVSQNARGKGLAKQMLGHILARPKCNKVRYLETTITETNQASWALFQGLAHKLDCELKSSTLFERERHFNNVHDTEMLVRIGPIG
ncbi:MAG: diaminobutyrate acetyltransferase [Gammaproteobacteria bacterium HGW-Gammaproteobacteria-3]|nr:MAG: diaminobutyrate acetyltransferase [Gammaproteobacteria bacterium HGW-Gammaproteobacteria-3]